MFALGRNRSLGLDDFPNDCYIACWDIIGAHLVNVFQEILRVQNFSRSWKVTFIAIIPKVTNPTSFREFRPISFYNVR